MKNSMVESLLSLLRHLGILTNTRVAVNSNKSSRTATKPARTVARGFSNGNIQNTIKGASHSVMETQNALEIKEEPQPKELSYE
jgi:hypothetical protein